MSLVRSHGTKTALPSTVIFPYRLPVSFAEAAAVEVVPIQKSLTQSKSFAVHVLSVFMPEVPVGVITTLYRVPAVT